MNIKLTLKTIGQVLLVESALMLIPLAVALLCGGGDAAAIRRTVHRVYVRVVLSRISDGQDVFKRTRRKAHAGGDNGRNHGIRF